MPVISVVVSNTESFTGITRIAPFPLLFNAVPPAKPAPAGNWRIVIARSVCCAI